MKKQLIGVFTKQENPLGLSGKTTKLHHICLAMLMGIPATWGGTTYSGHSSDFIRSLTPGVREITMQTFDLSGEVDRHVMIAQGTEEVRQGHASTILMPDGETLFIAWTYGHGGVCGPLKRSDDGGLTWSDLLDVPDNWADHANCPTLYRLMDHVGTERLISFVNRGPDGFIQYKTVSEDEGATWSPYQPVRTPSGEILGKGEKPAPTVMPFTAIIPVNGGMELLGVTNLRRPGETGPPSNVIAQSRSSDGGLTWSEWEIILDLGEPFRPCEPELIRSPDGSQILMLIRENRRTYNSWIMLSEDQGKTWSDPYQTSANITMDRHRHITAPDGRLVIAGRDNAAGSPTRGHFVAWIGSYDELVQGGAKGCYRVKLLHSHRGNVEYPSLEILPDGSILAINSLVYRPGENYSIVSTRFSLEETDRLASGKDARRDKE